jgi:hypothetical protein
MAAYPVSRGGSLPVEQLPSVARTFSDLPYSAVTEISRKYHLQTYERWCRERGEKPWPPTLSRLMRYAADRAQTKAFFTVREHVRIVSMVERRRTGSDLYAHPTMQTLLEGIKRERPPAPVRPLRPSQVETLFSFQPCRAAQHRNRAIVLLSYSAGFTLGDHATLRCEMVSFAEEGAIVSGLSDDRPYFVIGRASDPQRCPVEALRTLIGERAEGFVYISSRCRAKDRHLPYSAIGGEIAGFGRAAGVRPLSNDRLRLAGMLEQIQHVDIVRLAHFHGYRQIEPLAQLLGRYVPTSARHKAKWRT